MNKTHVLIEPLWPHTVAFVFSRILPDVTDLLVFDPLQLPLDDHLGQVHRQFSLLNGHAGREAKTLHRTDHVLHQVVAHGIVHLKGASVRGFIIIFSWKQFRAQLGR